MRRLASAMLLVVGVVHLLPVAGVLGAGRLEALYGVPVDEPNLEILLRHRAVLFGLLGVFLVVAAFERRFQRAAFLAGSVSVVSFLVLALTAGSVNGQLGRVVAADWLALGCLAVGAAARLYARRRETS